MAFVPQVNNNLFYESQINELKRQLNKERNKNQILNQKINELNIYINNYQTNINNYENKIKMLEKEIQKYKSNYNYFYNTTNSSINILKPGEKVMSINFVSMGNQEVGHYSQVCKNTDTFIRLEEKLNNDFPRLKNYETYFEVNGKRIKILKTFDKNKIKHNDIINIFLIDA